MAHFTELDSNNKVLKVVVACNQDIANNGGEQSVAAATHFESVLPLSSQGVKYVQTSYNSNAPGSAGSGDTPPAPSPIGGPQGNNGGNCINADDYTWDSENETWVGIVV